LYNTKYDYTMYTGIKVTLVLLLNIYIKIIYILYMFIYISE